MQTGIEIDETLVAETIAKTGAKTGREAVGKALRDTSLAKRRLKAFDELRGIGWEGDLNDMRTSKYIFGA